MIVQTLGRLTRPSLALIGAWDPLTRAHFELIQRARRAATRSRLDLAIVVLNPHPAAVVTGAKNWPSFSDVRARSEELLRAGAAGVILVRMSVKDTQCGSQWFLDRLRPYLTISRVWLGNRQTLGRETFQATRDTLTGCGISSRRLPTSDADLLSAAARRFLKQGQIVPAKLVAGALLLWKRPPSRLLALPWPPGRYIVRSLDESIAGDLPHATVFLRRVGRRSVLSWPEQCGRWIEFLSGPNDRPRGKAKRAQ
jgi:hypothetical protein